MAKCFMARSLAARASRSTAHSLACTDSRQIGSSGPKLAPSLLALRARQLTRSPKLIRTKARSLAARASRSTAHLLAGTDSRQIDSSGPKLAPSLLALRARQLSRSPARILVKLILLDQSSLLRYSRFALDSSVARRHRFSSN